MVELRAFAAAVLLLLGISALLFHLGLSHRSPKPALVHTAMLPDDTLQDLTERPTPSLLRCQRYCTAHWRLCQGEDVCYSRSNADSTRCMRECMARDGGGRIGALVGAAHNLRSSEHGNLHCQAFWLDVVRRSGTQRGLCDYACGGGGMCDASVPHTCEAYCAQVRAAPTQPSLAKKLRCDLSPILTATFAATVVRDR